MRGVLESPRRSSGLVLLIGLGLSYANGDMPSDQTDSQAFHTAEARALDLTSPAEVREWAERTCKGWTLAALARSLNVEPSIDAVVAFLSNGFPRQARAIVQEVCTRELSRPDRSTDA